MKRLARDAVVSAIAARLGATPAEIILAWLRSLSPVIVPIPGATRVETARSAARVVALDDAARAELAAQFLGRSERGAARDGEVVMIVGMPGAGKSTLAADYVAHGYTRLNRDNRGGTLRQLAAALDGALARSSRIVLDNTYPTRTSRAPVIAAAHRYGLPIAARSRRRRSKTRSTTPRLVRSRDGRLPEPDEPRATSRCGPGAQFRYRRQYEPPRDDEGFDAIDELPFTRVATPASAR